MRLLGRRCVVMLACLLVTTSARAEDVSIETLVTGLHRPCGIAVQPSGSPTRCQIFVSDTAAGRVIRVPSDAPAQVAEAITGFPTGQGGNGPFGQVGPRGLLFLDDYQLVVAAAAGGSGSLRTFGIPGNGQVLPADRPRQQLDLPAGNAWTIARTKANDAVPDLLVVAATGTDPQPGLLQSRVQADFLGKLQPFGGESSAGGLSAPLTVTVSPRGYVVVCQAGALDSSRDSKISILNPANGSPIMSFDANLRDVTGVAYGTDNVYAIDFSAAAPDDGGVYRIEAVDGPGAPACKAVKVADVRHLTAMAFGPDGALYVTTFGDGDADGTLVRITGL